MTKKNDELTISELTTIHGILSRLDEHLLKELAWVRDMVGKFWLESDPDRPEDTKDFYESLNEAKTTVRRIEATRLKISTINKKLKEQKKLRQQSF